MNLRVKERAIDKHEHYDLPPLSLWDWVWFVAGIVLIYAGSGFALYVLPRYVRLLISRLE